MTKKKSKIILFLLIANFFIPFILLFVSSNVTASWMGESVPLSRPDAVTLDIDEVSLAFASNGTMHYVYTQFVEDAGDYQIYYGNNSAGKDKEITLDIYDMILSDGTSLYDPLNTTDNHNSDIAVDGNTVHVVYQGKGPGQSNNEIYYTNNFNWDFNGNLMNISTDADAADQIDPSIVAVDGYVFIVYRDDGSNDIVLHTNFDGNTIGTDIDPTSTAGDRNPKLSLWKNETDWRVDLAWIDASGDIYYSYIDNGTSGVGTAFNNNKNQILATYPSVLSIDSSSSLAAICFVDSDDEVYVANSTKSAAGTAKRVTNTGVVESNPDVVINENNLITVFYERDGSAGGTDSTIRMRDNYGSWFANEDTLIGPLQVNSQAIGINVSSFDVAMCPGEGVMILYTASYQTSGEVKEKHVLYLSGYANFYNDDSGEYNYLTWEDDLTGSVYSYGWLLEGLQINYNIASGNPLDVIIRIWDNASGTLWENRSILSGSGGNDYKHVFYQPGNYFIARNKFNVSILNGSTQKDLFCLEIDPLLFSNGTYYTNASSNYAVNGTFLPYTLSFYSIGFEESIFFYDRSRHPDGIWNRDDHTKTNQSSYEHFHSGNAVDLYKFKMLAGEQYNMSLTTFNSGDNDTRLLIFNSTDQITSPTNAMYTFNITSANNGTNFQMYSPIEQNYYVVVENLDYGLDYYYNLTYFPCPMIITGSQPSNSTYIGKDYVSDFTQLIMNATFSWGQNPDDYIVPDHYIFQLYSESGVLKTLKNGQQPGVITGTSVNFVLRGTSNPLDYVLLDGTYYWNLTAVSGKQRSRPVQTYFILDHLAPSAPIISEQQGGYSFEGAFTVTWSVPDPKIHYYKLYRGETSSFIPDDNSNLITLGTSQTSNSITEHNMKTDSYYYKVIAVDKAGWESPVSLYGKYVVSLEGYVDPSGQQFNVLPGQYLKYQIVHAIDGGNKDPNTLTATFLDYTFQMNTIIHYYITDVSADEVFPVVGDFYIKFMNLTAQQLDVNYTKMTSDFNLNILVTSANQTYQKRVFDLFLKNEFGNASSFSHVAKNNTYYSMFRAIDVVTHSYYGNITWTNITFKDIDFNYDAVIFIVDRNTGVLIEMTVFDDYAETGYSIKLIETNIGLSDFAWWMIPLTIIFLIGVVAALLNLIIKKLERRV